MEDRAVDIGQTDPTLRELIARYGPNARIVLKDGEQVVGRLLLKPQATHPKPGKRTLGLHRGSVLYMAEDFDAPLPDEFWLGGDP